jgi:hypothetical protein
MHTVPEGCPVYQAYAFFNPTLDLPGISPWPMARELGRAYAKHDAIEVMHQSPRAANSFV